MQFHLKNTLAYTPTGFEFKDLYIKNGKFVSEHAMDFSMARKIDLDKRLVLPGLMDSHLHLYNWSVRELMPPIRETKTIADFLSVVDQYMLNLEPSTSFVYLSAWNEEQFEEKRRPSLIELNQVSHGIPLLCSRICGHVGLANQALLDQINWKVWREKNKSFVGVDSEGKPNGIITEDFYNHVLGLVEDDTFEEKKRKILFALKHLAKLGIQDFASNDVYLGSDEEFWTVLESVYDENPHLPNYFAQICLSSWEEIPAFLALQAKYQDHEKITISQVKLFKDGSLGGRTALLREPYKDMETFGADLIPYEELLHWFQAAENYQVTLVLHAIGDRALEDIVHAYVEIMGDKAPHNPNRHSIIHAQIHDRHLLHKLHASGLGILTQPMFAVSDWDMAESRLGERLENAYLFKTAWKMGIHEGFSSDSPVESNNPYHTIAAAMSHPLAEESFQFNEALKLHSETNQWFFYRENSSGKIALGQDANLNVLDLRNMDALDNPRLVKDLQPILSFNRGKILEDKQVITWEK